MKNFTNKEKIIYKNLLKEFKRYDVLNEELFDTPLNNIDKISDTEYIINEEGIKVKFYFRREYDTHIYKFYLYNGKEIPDFYFDMNWNWLEGMDEELKTPKSWLKVTATVPKIIDDFIKTNNPLIIKFSFRTEGNGKVYNHSKFLNTVELIFSDKYDLIKVPDPFAILLVRKDYSGRFNPSIKKLHINGDMSLEEAHEYWTNPEKRLMEGKMKGIVKNDHKRNKIKRIYYKIYFL
jgi:hypothetical protein